MVYIVIGFYVLLKTMLLKISGHIFTSLKAQIVDFFVACMYKKVHLSDMWSIHLEFHVDSIICDTPE